MAVTLKILSLLQHLHLQIDLWEGICIACNILFKDHMCACQWSDTGPPGPLVGNMNGIMYHFRLHEEYLCLIPPVVFCLDVNTWHW